MSILRSATDPRWTAVATADLGRTLCDHAYCERKAAASALKLVADHADRPELVRPLARLAQEEQQHLMAVLVELSHRGAPLLPDEGDRYAQALLALMRTGRARLLDRLLVCALIEARSCERLALLGEALPPGRLRDLYRRLAQSEAGHERLFVELAAAESGATEARTRLEVLSREEAHILAGLPLLPRIH